MRALHAESLWLRDFVTRAHAGALVFTVHVLMILAGLDSFLSCEILGS